MGSPLEPLTHERPRLCLATCAADPAADSTEPRYRTAIRPSTLLSRDLRAMPHRHGSTTCSYAPDQPDRAAFRAYCAALRVGARARFPHDGRRAAHRAPARPDIP